MNPEKLSWVALIVRPRSEQKAEAGLVNAGIETFVAWHLVRRRWSDRLKAVRENLFPRYVFCRSSFSDRSVVMRQPGVERVVSFNRVPAAVADSEIDTVRRLITSDLPLGPWPFLSPGQSVRIERGVLAGLEGTLVRDCSTWKLVISVNALQSSISVQVERDMIVPLNGSANYQSAMASL
jgi:transcription antitermination factor NusG